MKARLGAPEAIPAKDDSDPFGGAHLRVPLRGSLNDPKLSDRGVRRGPSMVGDG